MAIAFASYYAIAASSQAAEADALPDFDKRLERKASTAVSAFAPTASALAANPTKAQAVARIKSQVSGVQIQWDALMDCPAHIISSRGFLTGPDGQGKAVVSVAAKSFAPGDPYRAAKAFMTDHADLLGHDSAILAGTVIKRDFVTEHNGLRTTTWQQFLDNIPVFEANITANITKAGELVTLSSVTVPELAKSADLGTPKRRALQAAPTITASKALILAAQSIGEQMTSAQIVETPAPADEQIPRRHFSAPAVLSGESVVGKTWLPLSRESMRLCWETCLTSRKRGEMFHVLIDAETGEIWSRQCLTDHVTDVTYRVYTSDSPTPLSPGFDAPTATQPFQLFRSLVKISALNLTASPKGWIPDDGLTPNAPTLTGNNVNAYLDRNNDNFPDLPLIFGTTDRVFDFPLDLSQAPSTYGAAATTQLFYWCNWMHDTLYGYGFTEAAGNFQSDNFNRGGSGNDPVVAEAQDSSTSIFNNANFSTPPDGFNRPRMQVYLFNRTNPNRDGDLDAELILHEYTHGLSHRMINFAFDAGAPQAGGMGEGWGDFYALSLLSSISDDPNRVYAFGAYATADYYFGIRRYPYCTDMNNNPLTFKDIDPAQANAHAGVQIGPRGSAQANEVHNVGEVWCSALWDARANLIARYGQFGNSLMVQIVTDGMRMSGVSPNFLQARDGILQADAVNNGGLNYTLLWAAFAKRGMGESATSPNSATTTGVVETFDTVIHVDKATFPTDNNGSDFRPYPSVFEAYSVAKCATAPLRVMQVKTGTYTENLEMKVPLLIISKDGPVTLGH